MEKRPAIVAKRLAELREGIRISQTRLAMIFEIEQSAIFRYENAQSFPSYGVLMQYADFFNVSLDYIFGRTDDPRGKLYDFEPKLHENDEHIREFVKLCFDSKSAVNAKLRKAITEILKEEKGIL